LLYEKLLRQLTSTGVGSGQAALLQPTQAWPGNPTAGNIVVIEWQPRPPAFVIVVVNLAAHRGQCYVGPTVKDIELHDWSMKDFLGDESYMRSGYEMRHRGLYLDLDAHGAQLFVFEPLPTTEQKIATDYANATKVH
jgi:hypothetical protein